MLIEEDEDEEVEEEHPTLADSVPPPVHRVTAKMSILEQPPIPFWSEAEIARLLAIPSPPPSPLSPWSSPLPQIPSPPLPVSSPVPVSPPPLPASPTYPLGYRSVMIWLRAETPSTSHPLPSSTPPSGTPPLLPIPLPTPSPPLLFVEQVFPSSSAPTARPTGGFRVDYGFVATLDDEIRRDPERDDTEEIYKRLDDAQDNRTLVLAKFKVFCMLCQSWLYKQLDLDLENVSAGDKMDAGTNSITLTAKLPILNPGDYDLWLMRIEQYFLMIDYSLWEVIKNGNKVLKKTVGETKQEYEPTTAEEKIQLKFHSYKDAKLLMEAIEKRLQKLISQLEIQASQPNSPQLAQEDLEQIDPDDLEEMDLQWEMAMLTIRARRFIKRTNRKLDVNGQRIRFDRSKVDCYNCHKYGHFSRECRAPRNQENRGREINRRTVTIETPTENALVAQDGIGGYDWSYQAEEEHPTNFALMAHTSSGSSSSSDSEVDSYSKSCVKAYATLKEQYDSLSFRLQRLKTKEIRKANRGRDELKLTLEKFQNSSKSLNNLLESQVVDKFKTGLGYNAASSTTASLAVERNFISRKPDLTFMDEIVKSENMNVTTIITPRRTALDLQSLRIGIFEIQWVEIIPKDKTVSSSTEKIKFVKTARETVEKGNPRQKEYKEKGAIDSGCSRHMTGNKCYLTEYEDYDGGFVFFGDGKAGISGKGKIKTGTLDFDNVYFCKELKYNLFSVSKLCDKKNNVLFTDTECLVLSSDFKLLDESQVLLRVPRKDNIYSVDLKSVVPTKGLTCLFAKATIDESNLWHRRLEIENQLDHKVKVIRCDNGTEFKNSVINQFCEMKGIKREFSVARTPQQNGVARGEENGLKLELKNYEMDQTGFLMCSSTYLMNYVPVVAGNQTNGIAGTKDNIVTDPKVSEEDAEEKPTEMDKSGASDKYGKYDQAIRSEFERLLQQEKQTENPNSTNSINTISTPVSTAGPSFTNDDPSLPVNAAKASNAFEEHLFERFSPFKNAFTLPPVSNVTLMDDTGIFGNAFDDEDVGADADLNNLETTMKVSPIPTTRIDKDRPKDQIIGDFNSTIQTKRMTKIFYEHTIVCYINKQMRTNHKDYQNYLFACFLSQMEPKKVIQALEDPSWIEATQEELLQFKLQKVWTLVDLPNGKRAIGKKWVFRNKKDERGIIVRNKARLMDVKSAFLYGTIEEEVYVCQPSGFEDSQLLPENVYVDDIIFGSTKKSLCDEFEGLMHKRFQMSSMGELTFFLGLQVQQKKDGIFISQDKYVADILKKFDFATMKTASTPMEPNKALIKDEEADSVDVHLYRSMIGSLMYLTASRPDIMFVVCACARFQVTPKMSHLHVVKRIFRYLKGQPKLGLWYPKDSPFDLEAFSDSDYVGASLDRKSTTGGCQFLGKRLISWQCKKQAIVANSTT
ncbi:putative ribonuclease H-like domain-containing protein [Tanacetum coccineum]